MLVCVYACVRIVPPRWIVEPSDVSVERNRQIALHCQAQGVPTPVIVWKKTTGERHKPKVYELFIQHASRIYCIYIKIYEQTIHLK